MRILENGVYRDATEEELKAAEKSAKIAEAIEKQRPLSQEEVFMLFAKNQVNELNIPDETSVRMKGYYPAFSEVVGQTVKQGFKFTDGDTLYKTNQPEMTIQEHYPPGEGMESLYSVIDETHEGTMEDPIPYNPNMAVEKGKYYLSGNAIYLCIRDSGNPLYSPLEALIGNYFEQV